MHLTHPATIQLEAEFREMVLRTLEEEGLRQSDIAKALGMSESMVSRYLGGYIHWPAFLTPLLQHPRLRCLAAAIIEFQANKLSWRLEKRMRVVNAVTNGDLSDELLDMVEIEGQLSHLRQSGNIAGMEKLLRDLQSVVDRAKDEVEKLRTCKAEARS